MRSDALWARSAHFNSRFGKESSIASEALVRRAGALLAHPGVVFRNRPRKESSGPTRGTRFGHVAKTPDRVTFNPGRAGATRPGALLPNKMAARFLAERLGLPLVER